MSEKQWRSRIERLRRDPQDTEALADLERYLEEREGQQAERVRRAAGMMGRTSRYMLSLFLGQQLHRAIQDFWDAWSAYFRGEYRSEASASAWPEEPSRDLAAAVGARFIRIGLFGIFIGLIPAILLGFQTALMIVQVWQVNTQNAIIKEQNTLTREQFGVGYRAQFVEQLYAPDNERVTGRGDYKAEVCAPQKVPSVRAEAAASVVTLASVLNAGEQDAPRPTLAGACLRDVSMTERDLSRAVLDGAYLWMASFEQVDFSGASLHEVQAHGVTFKESTLDEVQARQPDFTWSSWRATSAKRATLLNPKFGDASFVGVDFTGAQFYPDDEPAMRSNRDIANFSDVRAIKQVVFRDANLISARFVGRTLLDVEFDGANLTQSNFEGAHLTKVSFREANLSKANLSGTTLIDVDLTGATVEQTKLKRVTYKNVTCPDGTNSDAQGGTCTL